MLHNKGGSSISCFYSFAPSSNGAFLLLISFIIIIFVYRRGCLLYHLSTEKLLIFESERQYAIYSKRNEPRLSVVRAFFINIMNLVY
nr:MAG TPA: hypothetical protein [Caudoviricetes sp.]